MTKLKKQGAVLCVLRVTTDASEDAIGKALNVAKQLFSDMIVSIYDFITIEMTS